MTSSTNTPSCSTNIATALSLKDTLEVCWLDSHISEDGQHEKMKSCCKNISKLISKWHFFDTADLLKDYLEQNPNVKLITIMSGKFARQQLALLSPKANLHSVYVFTFDIERQRNALGEEPKLKGIFNMENELFEQLQNDLSELFWEEGKTLTALHRDQEARVYFEDAHRLDKHCD